MNTRRIAAMPTAVAEAIAAGEVIERPASVVKELLENALDAQAREIELRLLKGGKLRIEVADDGGGIDAEDLPLALARHASSKLYTFDDLEHLRTFGFRGEALASMAAVADVTLTSRPAEAPTAATIHADAGQAPQPTRPAARRAGTTVVVEHLFRNLPARLKFLRSDATELQKVRDVVKVFLIAAPGAGFTIYVGDRLQTTLPPSTLLDRLTELMPDVPWLSLGGEDGGLRVGGAVSHPHAHRGDSRELHLYVNGRWVRDAALRRAVLQGCERAIPEGRAPLGAIFIDMDPAAVDVNVHPSKTEIRFREPGAVFHAVRAAVERALVDGRRPPGTITPGLGGSPAVGPGRMAETPTATAPGSTPDSAPGNRRAAGVGSAQGHLRALVDGDAATMVAAPAQPYGELVALGALNQRYLLLREGDALVIVDQHAAHERIRYDRIVAALEGGASSTQELLVPATFAAEPGELEGFRRGGDRLARIGFVVEPFGPATLRVRAVPRWFRGDAAAVVRATLGELAEAPARGAVDRAVHDLAASLACKGAVLSGRDMAPAEQTELLRQLRATPGADTCPHGRPTWRRITAAELDRTFGRI